MTLSLFPELDAPPSPTAEKRRARLHALPPAPRSARSRHPVLWLCLRFPGLPLQALSADHQTPSLVVEGAGSLARVVALNAEARRQGVTVDIPISLALALIDQPCLLHRSIEREKACLARAADAAMGFTDRVSLLPGEGLLLEVRGSLRLFGGLAPLLEAVTAGMRSLGLHFRYAVAPTPLAARALARAAPGTVVEDRDRLRTALGRLPLNCLDLDETQLARLTGMGCHCLSDVLRLPRDGLGRRFGPALREGLDRALGDQPDPRPCWRGQLHFQATRELPAETDRIAMLVRHCRPLLEDLCRFLHRHDSQVEWLMLHGRTERGPSLHLRLGLPDGSRSQKALADLLAIRMESLRIEAPVRELTLESGPLRHHQGRSHGLFREAGDAGRERELLGRLRARLGDSGVYAIAAEPCHDPGRSWRVCEPGSEQRAYARADRPLWLLSRPCVIVHPSTYRPIAGPERIETGWWSGHDIARDYYRAINQVGQEAWIFRDRRSRQWFLHGLFG